MTSFNCFVHRNKSTWYTNQSNCYHNKSTISWYVVTTWRYSKYKCHHKSTFRLNKSTCHHHNLTSQHSLHDPQLMNSYCEAFNWPSTWWHNKSSCLHIKSTYVCSKSTCKYTSWSRCYYVTWCTHHCIYLRTRLVRMTSSNARIVLFIDVVKFIIVSDF